MPTASARSAISVTRSSASVRMGRARPSWPGRRREAALMIPLKDDVPSQTVPVVTLMLIGLNVAVFLYQLSLQLGVEPGAQRAAEEFVREFGVTPCRLTGGCRVPAD